MPDPISARRGERNHAPFKTRAEHFLAQHGIKPKDTSPHPHAEHEPVCGMCHHIDAINLTDGLTSEFGVIAQEAKAAERERGFSIKPCEHCWCTQVLVETTAGPVWHEICCNCGTKRVDTKWNTR